MKLKTVLATWRKKMKKKIKTTFIFLLFFLTIYYLITLLPITPADKEDMNVLLIHNPKITGNQKHILAAYKSVFEEEGIPFKAVAPSFLLSSDPEDLVATYPVIVLPDRIARALPSDMKFWIKEYLEKGGDVALIYDAGSQNLKFQFLNKTIFSDLVGVNYVLYNQLPDSSDAYTTAYLRFKDDQATRFFQVPPGKTNAKHFVSGYSYGQLVFPVARSRTNPQLAKKDIYAYCETERGDTYPAIILKNVFSGRLLYVNLPLGHLKAESDDLLLRAIMRTFLFKVAKIPHLLSTPDGKAGLVINWHIDWNEDRKGLQFMKENGFFTNEIKYSIHNTAGDFTDRPNDGLGFDAAGRGKNILKSVLKYGTLGSHGGWAHNWFYSNILNGNFKEKEIEKYIKLNNKTLEAISGYPVTEYSAPNGVHPQPLATNILERNGVIAYYYTGDSGSAPNRTFFDKKMVSKNVIAFPVLSYRKVASFFEMNRDGISKDEIKDWLHGLLDFLLENRTIRLIYSHSYDVAPYYPNTFKAFLLKVDQACKEGKLNAKPMSYFAKFLQRFLLTKYRFKRKPNRMEVHIKNPEGIWGIAMAIPKDKYEISHIKGVQIETQGDYYYLIFKESINEKTFTVNYRHH
jgi:hypothetical protein